MWQAGCHTQGSVPPRPTHCQRCASARLAGVDASTDDTFSIRLSGRYAHGYLPRDLGLGYLDLHFFYCLDCGQIRGQFPLFRTALEEAIQ